MITNKDIRVENGNLVLNGDKFPLNGQSPEAIMKIVEDNSDTTPTENSTKPVKSSGIYSKIGDLTQTGITGDSVAEQLGTAKVEIATLNSNLNDIIEISASSIIAGSPITLSNQKAYIKAGLLYASADATIATHSTHWEAALRVIDSRIKSTSKALLNGDMYNVNCLIEAGKATLSAYTLPTGDFKLWFVVAL